MIITFILDLSGVVNEIETAFQRRYKRKFLVRKPWSCSLCMTWWVGLIYLLVVGKFTIPMIGLVALLSFMTPVLKDLMLSVRELLNLIVWMWDRRGE